MTAGYDGGSGMILRMFNTMFAGTNGTAPYVGRTVSFAREDHDLHSTGGSANGAIDYRGHVYSESALSGGKWMAATGLGTGTFGAVPVFASGTDFHLQVGSPGVDQGIVSGAPSTSLDGITRPQGSDYDIGPFER